MTESKSILLVGATGVLGSYLVPILERYGYQVFGLVRSGRAAERADELGAVPIGGDILDPVATRQAVAGHDVVIHAATAIPRDPTTPGAWQENDDVRTRATANLLAACETYRTGLYVQQSVVFVYGDQGDSWVDESRPPSPYQPAHLRSAVEMEMLVQSSRIPWVILRGGFFLASHFLHVQQLMGAARTGISYRAEGEGYVSPVHPEDMARAIALAVREMSSSVILNVVDDRPVREREFLEYLVSLVGGPEPRPGAKKSLLPLVRASNARVRKTLGFSPRYASFRESLTATDIRLPQHPREDRHDC